MSRKNPRDWRSGTDLMSRLTNAIVFLTVFHTIVHLFYLYFVMTAPFSLTLTNYMFLGLNVLDLMGVCSVCIVIWILCQAPRLRKSKRKLLPIISFSILIFGSFGSLYYNIMLHRFDHEFRKIAAENLADVNTRLENLGPRDQWLKSYLLKSRQDLQKALGESGD